jgi:gas vesicle protein
MYNTPDTETKSGVGGFFLGFLTGALIAGAAVMLYSPKAGTQTRSQLREELDKTQVMLQHWAEDIRQRANEFSRIISFREETVVGSHNGHNGQEERQSG